MSGSTTSELSVSDASAGEINAQLTLRVRTMSGDIEIRRAGQASTV
jgi:hypothetical protein